MTENNSDYKLNIDKDMTQYGEMMATCNLVDSDFPADYLTDEEKFEAFVMITSFGGNQTIDLPEDRREEYDAVRKYLFSRMESEEVSRTFITDYQGEMGYREVTVGLIDKPFSSFLDKFDPAREWGKNLVGYVGGELVVDEFDTQNRVVLLRERMILATPWFILGAPDSDMSKYEKIQYDEDSVKVNWVVKKSPDNSVYFDFGYFLFKKYISENGGKPREKTMVFFNSLLKTDIGYMEKVLPESMQAAVVLKAMANMFSDYAANYRKIVMER